MARLDTNVGKRHSGSRRLMRRAHSRQLLRISKVQQKQLASWREGVAIERNTGYSLDQLVAKLVGDRLALARAHLNAAQNALAASPPRCRAAQSRAYYSLYQAFRGVVFFMENGDDFEKHSDLPDKIPDRFPLVAHWKNELKLARLERNRADYDPYPRNEQAFRTSAQNTIQRARELLPLARTFLRSQGWTP